MRPTTVKSSGPRGAPGQPDTIPTKVRAPVRLALAHYLAHRLQGNATPLDRGEVIP